MSKYVQIGSLKVATQLVDFVDNSLVPGLGLDAAHIWTALEDIVEEFAPRNKSLLERRQALQAQMDEWCREHAGMTVDPAAYRDFLIEIGYLVPEGETFKVTTANVDPEISSVAGPQLVVPVMNARYALNAANARWGSLYDALYGTDVISEADGASKGAAYNPARGAKVIAYASAFLDKAAPLEDGSHANATRYARDASGELIVTLKNGSTSHLKDPQKFVGYLGDEVLHSVLLVNNGLHLDIQIDPSLVSIVLRNRGYTRKKNR